MLQKEILYSFVVPVYKVEKYLQECIDSIKNQSYQNIEIILVDDGSPDRSGEICDINAERDNRIKVIHKTNGGVSSARLAGVEAAEGEYILCVDSDDWVSSDCVSKINEVIIRNGMPDVVTYGHHRITEHGDIEIKPTVPEGLYCETMKRAVIFPHLIQNDRAEYYLPGVCGECFRRELLHRNMIATSEAVIGEDMACTIPCIYHAESVYVLNECLYYYRFNEESVTKGKKVFPWSCAKVLAEHLESKIDLSDADLQMQVYRYVVHMLFVTAASQFYLDDSEKNIKMNIANNLSDDFYKNAISKCKFKLFSKGWMAHFALKHRLWNLIMLYNKR